MSALNLGTRILVPVPEVAIGSSALRRRASAPELAKLTESSCTNTPYAVGNLLRLQVAEEAQDDRSGSVIRAEIIKLFTPFTMAPVMVVRIHEPALDLEGEFVLKVYDRIHANSLRSDRDETWDLDRDLLFKKHRWRKGVTQYFDALMAEDLLNYDLEEEEKRELDADAEDPEIVQAYEEWYIYIFGLKMYRAELEMYRRARRQKRDGYDMPRFISSVCISHSYTSKACATNGTDARGTPGILMQYLRGFPLDDLVDSPSPKSLRSTWQFLVDEAVHIAISIANDLESANTDCSPHNTVVHWDPFHRRWKPRLIDFGHCEFKREGVSDAEWRRTRNWADEDLNMGRWMKFELEKKKGFEYVWKRDKYYEEIHKEFNSDATPRD